MKNFLVLIYFIFTCSLPAFASGYQDPHGILDKADEFLGKPNFNKAFKLGDWATYVSTFCEIEYTEDGNIVEDCIYEKNNLEVIRVSKKEAQIKSSSEEDPQALSKELYNKIKGNYIRLWLEMVSDEITRNFKNRAVLRSIKDIIFKSFFFADRIITNKKIKTMVITLGIPLCFPSEDSEEGEPECFELDMNVALAKGVPFISQLVEFKLGLLEETGEPVTKLIDFGRK